MRQLCRRCGSQCAVDEDDASVQIECPICDGAGNLGGHPCPHCVEGYFTLMGCPARYIGGDLIRAMNIAGMCGSGDWPVAGGLADQSAWFLNMKQTLSNEEAKIEKDQQDGSK